MSLQNRFADHPSQPCSFAGYHSPKISKISEEVVKLGLSEIRSDESGEGAGKLVIADPGNKQRTVTGAMENPPHVDFRIDTRSGGNIGYLYLDVFEDEAREQLDTASPSTQNIPTLMKSDDSNETRMGWIFQESLS